MTDILLCPIRLSELEAFIKNAVSQAFEAQAKNLIASPPLPQEILFDVPELAKYLKCKTDTIYANIDRYPRIKEGKSWKFFKSEIDNYLKENRKKTKAEIMGELKEEAEKQLDIMKNKTSRSQIKHTYIMHDYSLSLYKIGRSCNPLIRENTLMAQKPTIDLLFFIKEDVEKELHGIFMKNRVRGEWFNLSESDLEFIKLNYTTHDPIRH